jgi:hypothetical protein
MGFFLTANLCKLQELSPPPPQIMAKSGTETLRLTAGSVNFRSLIPRIFRFFNDPVVKSRELE